jgi:ABC-2 type transport system permease protein
VTATTPASPGVPGVPAARSALGGAVYDRGYRPYAGPRGSRREAAFAVWRLTVRRALGLRRSWRQKVFPWSLLAIATLPAVIEVGVGWAIRNDAEEFAEFNFTTYRDYVGVSTALLLFLALSAPDAICPDRRQRVLPLMFSRPLTGVDYVWAKLGAIAAILFGFGFLPQVVLFVGQMLVSDGALDYFTDNADVLWKVPLSVLALSVYYAAVGVALSSLTDRRIVGGVAIIGLGLVTSTVAGVFVATSDTEQSLGAVANLLFLPLAIRDLIFLGHVTADTSMEGVAGAGVLSVTVYLLVILVSLGVLFQRYRRVDL